jgi:hypothetical protein
MVSNEWAVERVGSWQFAVIAGTGKTAAACELQTENCKLITGNYKESNK